jgi:hypothetical protein
MGGFGIESDDRYARIIDLLLHFKRGSYENIISKTREYKDLYPEESVFLHCIMIKALGLIV